MSADKEHLSLQVPGWLARLMDKRQTRMGARNRTVLVIEALAKFFSDDQRAAQLEQSLRTQRELRL